MIDFSYVLLGGWDMRLEVVVKGGEVLKPCRCWNRILTTTAVLGELF